MDSVSMMNPGGGGYNQGGAYNPGLRRRQSCGGCLRYLCIIVNFLFVLLAAAVICVFIWIYLTQVWFVKGVLNTDLAAVSTLLLVSGGCLLLITALLGLGAACARGPGCALGVHVILLGVVALALLASVACALVLRASLTTDQVRSDMVTSLQLNYGVNLDKPWNKQVTESWDAAQTRWHCCSVRDNSWSLYIPSAWYRIQPGTPGNGKPYVPSSCCVLDRSTGQPINAAVCQLNQFGPPNIPETPQYAVGTNSALFYRGCYETARDLLLGETMWYVLGVAAGVALLAFAGGILGLSLCVALRREERMYYRNDMSAMDEFTVPAKTVSHSYAGSSYPNYYK